jgi:hypothetical protein
VIPPHPRIAAFVANLPSLVWPAGVSGYALGDTYRGPAAQLEAYQAGTSNALYGESAHSVGGPGWAGAAVDVFPLRGGNVSTDPADYQPIVSLAQAHDLESLGALYGIDWAHVQVPGWRSYAVVPPPDDGTWVATPRGWVPADQAPRRAGAAPLLWLLLLGAAVRARA